MNCIMPMNIASSFNILAIIRPREWAWKLLSGSDNPWFRRIQEIYPRKCKFSMRTKKNPFKNITHLEGCLQAKFYRLKLPLLPIGKQAEHPILEGCMDRLFFSVLQFCWITYIERSKDRQQLACFGVGDHLPGREVLLLGMSRYSLQNWMMFFLWLGLVNWLIFHVGS